MKEWYYATDGQQHGPVTLREMQELLRNGTIDPGKHLVWKQGMPDWKPVSEVVELSQYHPEDSLRGLIQASGTSPAAPSGAPVPASPGNAGEIEPGSDPIDIGACLSKGFEPGTLETSNFGNQQL